MWLPSGAQDFSSCAQKGDRWLSLLRATAALEEATADHAAHTLDVPMVMTFLPRRLVVTEGPKPGTSVGWTVALHLCIRSPLRKIVQQSLRLRAFQLSPPMLRALPLSRCQLGQFEPMDHPSRPSLCRFTTFMHTLSGGRSRSVLLVSTSSTSSRSTTTARRSSSGRSSTTSCTLAPLGG